MGTYTGPSTLYCEKCHRSLSEKEFYSSNNLQKYPNGKLPQCKSCITMHVDNWNPDTFLWILEEMDVPWIPDEWNKLMAKATQGGKALTGLSIIGKYKGKMAMKQFNQYRWADNEYLNELAKNKIETAMKTQGYSGAEIDQVIRQQRFAAPGKAPEDPNADDGVATPQTPATYAYPDPWQPPQQDDPRDAAIEIDIENDLSEDDIRYLQIKWGRAYKPAEWVQLEQLYQDMLNSYDIQGAGHEDILKLVCKTSLKSNQLLDIGDVDGAQKMVKMYDSLMKSGRFTALQNKSAEGEVLDSISEFVAMCEKDGFIPRFYTEGPKDRVDETLMDINHYTRTLVLEELNLGNLIENAVKQMVIQENKAEDEDIEEEEMVPFDDDKTLSLQDYSDFGDFVDEQEQEDIKFFDGLTKE